jgi:DNA replication and repair protein RecF
MLPECHSKVVFVNSKSGVLDDIFDKFDASRVKQIISLVAENQFGQIFITDTNEQRVLGILEEIPTAHRVFKIGKDAAIEEMET